MPFPGEIAVGELVSAAELNSLPGGVLGYAATTSAQTGITSETDLTGLSVTVDVAASRRIRVTGRVPVQQQTNDGNVRCDIDESSTSLSRVIDDFITTGRFASRQASVVLTPSTGSHTYKLTLSTSAGTVDTRAASGNPAFILVEDIGPA